MAPLGTSLTEEQAAQLAHHAHHHGVTPVVATDADLAGQIAAQRDYWLLTQHGLDPLAAALRPGSDPADVLALRGAPALRQVLDNSTPLADTLLAERLTNLAGIHAARQAVTILAADHPRTWDNGVAHVANRTGIPAQAVRRELAAAVHAWDADPRAVVSEHIADLAAVRARLATTSPHAGTPTDAANDRVAARRRTAPKAPSTTPRPTPRR